MSNGKSKLTTFLKNNKSSGKEYTHTRIPGTNKKGQNVTAGSYNIQSTNEFNDLYYTATFDEKNEEHLTEKQIPGLHPS